MSNSSVELIDKLSVIREKIVSELKKVIVGQDEVVEQVLIALFANGHVLLEGVPGLAKTLLISSLAKVLDLDFSRIQFTPDLMPSDITGTDILSESKEDGKRYFEYIKGPIFANVILADEINRTPPKTQAALLQAMQEYEITSGNKTYKLEEPFLVLATQNPIEQEGTYPLPEAQLDRFMFNIQIDYPSYEEEIEIVKVTTSKRNETIKPVVTGSEIIAIQKAILDIPVSDHVYEYAVKLVRSTRPNSEASSKDVTDLISWGAGPRASQYLVIAAKARAGLKGRITPSEDDIRYVAPLVLRHRVLPSFTAEAEGIKSLDIVNKLLK
ncbi:MAG: AAA family ATPase [Candidatus Cloacimonetes bacterium 4572_65]|nr:MAG: AAA family ATPase [Candidatus Cloacimonetes bacterium 4572_65]